MNQHQSLLHLFRTHPQGITTNAILDSEYRLAANYRARITELRQMGYDITCEKRPGGASIWRLVSEPAMPMKLVRRRRRKEFQVATVPPTDFFQ